MNVTIETFAQLRGQQQRKTRDASLPFHTAYTKGTDAQKADLRQRWMLNWVMGYLNVSEKKAGEIVAAGRGRNVPQAHHDAVDSARKDFGYHVVRATKTANQTKKVRVPSALRAAVAALIAEGYTAEQIKACL